MEISDVFELRRQGRREEAYEAARQIYAHDKGKYATSAMFWTAIDILRSRIAEHQIDEARKIYMALERLFPQVDDKNGWVKSAMHVVTEKLEHTEASLHDANHKATHLQMGVWGEDLAAAYLREKGYVILERDWHSGHRDIDIVAQYHDEIVFVEVKTRRSSDFDDPIKAVDYKKRRRLQSAINHYVKFHVIDNPIRFDIITVVGSLGSVDPEITHLENVNIVESPRY